MAAALVATEIGPVKEAIFEAGEFGLGKHKKAAQCEQWLKDLQVTPRTMCASMCVTSRLQLS